MTSFYYGVSQGKSGSHDDSLKEGLLEGCLEDAGDKRGKGHVKEDPGGEGEDYSLRGG